MSFYHPYYILYMYTVYFFCSFLAAIGRCIFHLSQRRFLGNKDDILRFYYPSHFHHVPYFIMRVRRKVTAAADDLFWCISSMYIDVLAGDFLGSSVDRHVGRALLLIFFPLGLD